MDDESVAFCVLWLAPLVYIIGVSAIDYYKTPKCIYNIMNGYMPWEHFEERKSNLSSNNPSGDLENRL